MFRLCWQLDEIICVKCLIESLTYDQFSKKSIIVITVILLEVLFKKKNKTDKIRVSFCRKKTYKVFHILKDMMVRRRNNEKHPKPLILISGGWRRTRLKTRLSAHLVLSYLMSQVRTQLTFAKVLVEQQEFINTGHASDVKVPPIRSSKSIFLMLSFCWLNSGRKINSTIFPFSKMPGLRLIRQWFKPMAEVGIWVYS